jgi:hypothetical protein
MAEHIFSIKQFSNFPPIRAALKDASGYPVPLTGLTVVFRLRRRGTNFSYEYDADIIDAVNGVVQYLWQDGDTDLSGDYDGEWVLNYPDGKKSVYPSDSYNSIRIYRSLV